MIRIKCLVYRWLVAFTALCCLRASSSFEAERFPPKAAGCYANVDHFGFSLESDIPNPPRWCLDVCKGRWFQFAALQFAKCLCTNELPKDKVPNGECDVPCAWNRHTFCGGINRIVILETYYLPEHELDVNKCWIKEMDDTVTYKGNHNTQSFCRSVCGAFLKKFAAVHNGFDCLCSNTFFGQRRLPLEMCNEPCSGNPKTNCGGHFGMFVMHSERTEMDIGIQMPEGCYWHGGYASPFSGRVSSGIAHSEVTIVKCQAICGLKKLKIAGLQRGTECWCGQHPNFNEAKLTDFEKCNIPCSGDASERCGGLDHMLVRRALTGGMHLL